MTDKELIKALRERIARFDAASMALDTGSYGRSDADLDTTVASRLEALSRSGGAVPAGWKLVPEEPTAEMIAAGNDLLPFTRGTETHRMVGGKVPEDYYRAMLSAAPPPPAGSGWRPIEEAPKDGTFVWLGTTTGPAMRLGYWADEQWNDFCRAEGTGPRGLRFQPTHWRPLPAPPSPQPSREG